MPKIVVASFMTPRPGTQFKEFCDLIVSDNVPGQMEIKSMVLVEGPGCSNYAFLVEGDDVENWANQFTQQVMGKWSYTDDPHELLKEGVFEDLRNVEEYALRNDLPKPTLH